MEFTADLAPFTETFTIFLYSDGIPEGEEGFLVLFGVVLEELEDDDKGFVNVLNQALLVRLLDGGESCLCIIVSGLTN